MGNKQCANPTCRQSKPATLEFFQRENRSSDGLSYRCKECLLQQRHEHRCDNVEKYRREDREYYRRKKKADTHNQLKVSQKDTRLRSRYGLSLDDYNELMEGQERKCAICLRQETIVDREGNTRQLIIDHNHVTGERRGLLCHSCNTMLGRARDDITVLESAIDYLEITRLFAETE